MTAAVDAAAMQCNHDECIAAGTRDDLAQPIGIEALGDALTQATARGAA